MTFLIRPGASRYLAQLQANALDTWRDTELLVQERWNTFLKADRGSRAGAFAAYLAALDAESAAARELADAHLAAAA